MISIKRVDSIDSNTTDRERESVREWKEKKQENDP